MISVISNKFASDNKVGWISGFEQDKSSYLSGALIIHVSLKNDEALACT